MVRARFCWGAIPLSFTCVGVRVIFAEKFRTNKMRKNVTFFIALALALSVGLLATGCRSHRHVQAVLDVQQRDSFAELVVRQSHSLSASTSSSSRTSDRNRWRITWNFDTSHPSDPETNLPPVSSIEVEGEEQTQEETSSTDDVSVETEDEQNEVSGGGEVNVTTVEDRDTEAGSRLGFHLVGVIPGILIIIGFIWVAKDVGKDSSV